MPAGSSSLSLPVVATSRQQLWPAWCFKPAAAPYFICKQHVVAAQAPHSHLCRTAVWGPWTCFAVAVLPVMPLSCYRHGSHRSHLLARFTSRAQSRAVCRPAPGQVPRVHVCHAGGRGAGCVARAGRPTALLGGFAPLYAAANPAATAAGIATVLQWCSCGMQTAGGTALLQQAEQATAFIESSKEVAAVKSVSILPTTSKHHSKCCLSATIHVGLNRVHSDCPFSPADGVHCPAVSVWPHAWLDRHRCRWLKPAANAAISGCGMRSTPGCSAGVGRT